MSKPEHIDLRGSRCRLRPTVVSDQAALVAIRSTPEVHARWRGDDLAEEFLEDLSEDDVVMLTIEDSNGAVVGLIQFAEEVDPEYRSAGIDIYVDPSRHRQGLATDAITTLVNFLFDEYGHHRLTIDPAASNAAAIDCYANVGFRPVGVMREYERLANGRWGDGLLMDMLATDRP